MCVQCYYSKCGLEVYCSMEKLYFLQYNKYLSFFPSNILLGNSIQFQTSTSLLCTQMFTVNFLKENQECAKFTITVRHKLV